MKALIRVYVTGCAAGAGEQGVRGGREWILGMERVASETIKRLQHSALDTTPSYSRFPPFPTSYLLLKCSPSRSSMGPMRSSRCSITMSSCARVSLMPSSSSKLAAAVWPWTQRWGLVCLWWGQIDHVTQQGWGGDRRVGSARVGGGQVMAGDGMGEGWKR